MEGWVGVVTGGASGIGSACLQLLEACGAMVYVADKDGEPAIDVTDRAALDRLAGEIRDRHGRLNVLVNAAGILTTNAPVDEIPIDDLVVAPVDSRSHAVSTLPVYVHWKGSAVWL